MDRRRFLAAGSGVGLLGTGGYLFRKRGPYEVVSLSATVERTAPDHRYTITDHRYPDSAADDYSVIEYAALPEELRSVFDPGRADYTADTLPDGTREILSEYDLIDFGEDASTRYVGFHLFETDLDSPPRLAVDAELLDSTAKANDPAVLEIRATNTGDDPCWIESGPPRPFGILRPEISSSGSSWRDDPLLWTDTYEQSDDVQTDRWGIAGGHDVAVVSELAPGDSVSEQYEIQPKRLAVGAGEYTLEQTFEPTFRAEDRPIGEVTVESRISWELERRQPI